MSGAPQSNSRATRVLRLLHECGPMSALAIACNLGMERQIVANALSSLCRYGKVIRREPVRRTRKFGPATLITYATSEGWTDGAINRSEAVLDRLRQGPATRKGICAALPQYPREALGRTISNLAVRGKIKAVGVVSSFKSRGPGNVKIWSVA